MNQLTGFRFILSFHILLYHTLPNSYFSPRIIYLNSFGSISTSMFIILSGFALSFVYSSRTINYKQFIYQRILKLYPLHLFIVFLSTIIFLGIFVRGEYDLNGKHYFAGLYEFLIAIFSQIFMIDSWNPFFLGINVSGWTLSCLFIGYLIFPSIIKRSAYYDMKILLAILFVLFICVLILPAIILFLGYNSDFMRKVTNIYSLPNFLHGLLHRNPIIRLPEFLMGIILFRLSEKKHYRLSTILVIDILLIMIAIMVFLLPNIPQEFLHNGFFIPFELFLIWILITRSNFITNILSNRILVLLGNMSFSLYLIHVPLYSIWLGVSLTIYRIRIYGVGYFLSKSEHLRVAEATKDFVLPISSYILYLFFTIFVCLFVQKYFVNNLYNKYKMNFMKY
jgi:peptidoglycan/LPS O-acetylase OafA/YrhL